MALRVRMQVTGTSPTTVRATVWPGTDAEPATWLTTATDSAAGLQAPGGIALTSYLFECRDNAPLVAGFSDLVARPAP